MRNPFEDMIFTYDEDTGIYEISSRLHDKRSFRFHLEGEELVVDDCWTLYEAEIRTLKEIYGDEVKVLNKVHDVLLSM